MIGLFNMLNLGARALQADMASTEVTGQNIANVNNPAYARQRVNLATSIAIKTAIGPEGTGVDAVAIQQIRDQYLDSQIQTETSVSGSLTAQQSAYEKAKAALGQSIDLTSITTGSAAASDATGTQHGIGDTLNALFTEFQNLANNPSSLTQRQVLLSKAQQLATQFNQTDKQFADVQSNLNNSLNDDVVQVNQLLQDIASLNNKISVSEAGGKTANDLRDTRQSKLEALAGLVNFDMGKGPNGAVDISINGNSLVSGSQVMDTLSLTDVGGGQLLLTGTSGALINLTGGDMQGIIEARDGGIATLRTSLNTLASTIISEVNAIHSSGYSLTGSSGADFFSGTSAADIQVNTNLTNSPSLLQASGAPGATGDNQVALALAQLADKPQTALNNQTFSENFTDAVTTFGQTVATVTSQISDQAVVTKMLQQQRSSTSGVSLDEETANMLKYQQAYQASAKIISTIDQMLSAVIAMKQ